MPHFDRWRNPAVEAQATDRAFRTGRMRHVQVHTPLNVGTMEERIDALMRRKQDLAERVVVGGGAWLGRLDTEALPDLVTLGQKELA